MIIKRTYRALGIQYQTRKCHSNTYRQYTRQSVLHTHTEWNAVNIARVANCTDKLLYNAEQARNQRVSVFPVCERYVDCAKILQKYKSMASEFFYVCINTVRVFHARIVLCYRTFHCTVYIANSMECGDVRWTAPNRAVREMNNNGIKAFRMASRKAVDVLNATVSYRTRTVYITLCVCGDLSQFSYNNILYSRHINRIRVSIESKFAPRQLVSWTWYYTLMRDDRDVDGYFHVGWKIAMHTRLFGVSLAVFASRMFVQYG